MIMRYLRIYLILVFFIPALFLHAQTAADLLTLSTVLAQVMDNYPALKKAEKELEAADAKIGLTQTAKLPDVNFTTTYNRIGPVTSFNFGGKEIQLYPDNMYNASLSVTENVYDFGKTAKNLELDKDNRTMVQLSAEQLRQRLSMGVMITYYSISFLQKAILIKDEELKNLNEHLQYVQKKEETGSATQFEILSTKVRISTIENQKTDLQTSLEVQISQLNTYLGKASDSPVLLKEEIENEQVIPSVDSLRVEAFANRYEMKIALQKEEISKSRLNVIKVQNNPSLNFQATGGFKNGYFNTRMEDVGKLNYSVGVGLKVPIFDANRSKYARIQTNADLEGNQQETELVRRNITNELVECHANVLAAYKKVKQSELQVQQAMQAYNLAEVSYRAGTITNLDLLDSSTALSESKLSLFKTTTDYSVNIQKLKIALGERIY